VKATEFMSADDDLLRCLIGALLHAAEIAPSELTHDAMRILARDVLERIESRLAEPRRNPDDWSIPATGSCRCKLCETLNAFLTDPGRRTLEWPIAP
jgi:hypothetical protein